MKGRVIEVAIVMIGTGAKSGIEKGVVTVGVAALLVALVAVVATVEVARIGT